MPKIKLKREPMSKDEVAQMIEHATCARDKALIAVLYISGARISEVLNMLREDVKWDDNYLYLRIRPLKRRDVGPLLKPNILPIGITAPFAQYIIDWVKTRKEGEHLFPGYKQKMSRVRAWQIIKMLNPNTFPHFFRHTRASKLAEAGADGFEIRDWLGRKTVPSEYVVTSKRRFYSLGKNLE